MKNPILVPWSILLALIAVPPDLQGQFSFTTMSYQGSISENGLPANGTNDLQFTVYDALTNGTVVGGPLLQEDVILSNGLFSVTLDFGTGVFNGQARWMELAVRPGDSTNAFSALSPRQPVSAVPYAIQANEATLAFSIDGALPSTNLVGTYEETISFTSDNNVFLGTFNGAGTGLTNVNAYYLNGLMADDFWQLDGNAGTTAGTEFLGTSDDEPLEFKVNNTRALRLEPTATGGAVNVIGGSPVNYAGPGVVGATIGGGGTLDDGDSTSHTNRVLADYGTVGGGLNNVAGGFSSVVSGGLANKILEFNSSNSGIGSGSGNVISNAGACSIGGGAGNSIQTGATWSHIGGGRGNTIDADYAVVPGGRDNAASANYAFAAGRRARANHSGTFVWADSSDSDFASSGVNQFLIRAGGGVGIGTTAPETMLDVQGGILSQVGNGNDDNVIIKKPGPLSASNVRFVLSHRTTGDDFWLYGYDGSTFRNLQGWNHTENTVRFPANGDTLYVDMADGRLGVGVDSPADIVHAQSGSNIRMRTETTSSGYSGYLSKNAMGEWFAGVNTGSDDWTVFENAPSSGNRLTIRSGGNVGIGIVNPTNKLHVAGGITCTALVQTSDRHAKQNVRPVSPAQVLAKVLSLPIATWEFRGSRDGRHLGPMAQDFHAAFGLGSGDTTITAIDADGVALAAIQGLNQKVETRSLNAEVSIQELKAENAALKARLERLERLLAVNLQGDAQ